MKETTKRRRLPGAPTVDAPGERPTGAAPLGPGGRPRATAPVLHHESLYRTRDEAVAAARLLLEMELTDLEVMQTNAAERDEVEAFEIVSALLEPENLPAVNFARGGLQAHRRSADCWCSPEVEHHPGGRIFIHREVM